MTQPSLNHRPAVGMVGFVICISLGFLAGLALMEWVDNPEDPERFYMTPAAGAVIGLCVAIARRLRKKAEMSGKEFTR